MSTTPKHPSSDLALRPSDAKRWLSCTAAPGFVADNADKIVMNQKSVC